MTGSLAKQWHVMTIHVSNCAYCQLQVHCSGRVFESPTGWLHVDIFRFPYIKLGYILL